MPDSRNLPFLLRLLDDETPAVRSSVVQELVSFGDFLDEELTRLFPPPTPKQREAIEKILKRNPEGFRAVPVFRMGQLVRHQFDDWRGLVVQVDQKYESFEEDCLRGGQGAHDQPWYRIFVDNSDQVTYAPQSDLVADESIYGVLHPLVPYFFTLSREGTYKRNAHPFKMF